MTLQERADAFARAFPKWPAAWPRVVEEKGRPVLYATFVLGNDYRLRSTYYGAYPHGYLPRVLALFPDVSAGNTLHVFSGSLPAGDYARCDAVQEAEYQCSVYDLPARARDGISGRPFEWDLVLADPPYSAADAEKYGYGMVNRRRATAALAQVTRVGGHLVWLDTVWPQFRKDTWRTAGRILVQRSTNHRVRVVSIFERVAA